MSSARPPAGPGGPIVRAALGLSALCFVALCKAQVPLAAKAAEPASVSMQVEDPRPFGHVVGDVLTRRVLLDVPRRLRLVDASIPSPGRIAQSFELRRVQHDERITFSGTRHTLTFDYQVFRAPAEPVVLDLPAFTLRLDGEPRGEAMRVDFAPVGMVPLLPADAVLRAGFGTQRPDVPAQAIDTAPERTRLLAYGLVALLPLGYLGYVYLGWPWWQRRHRPFAFERRRLQRLSLDAPANEWLAAWRRMHAALDASAGHVLHPGVLDRWVDQRPAFASLHEELSWFFERSQAIFFAGDALRPADRERLLVLCRRCFDVERGRA